MAESLSPSSSFTNSSGPPGKRIRKISHRKPLMHPSSYTALSGIENEVQSENSCDEGECEVCGKRNTKFHHHAHGTGSVNMASESLPWEDYNNVSATFNRHKYYSRLVDPRDDRLRIPDHILPMSLFYVIPTKSEDKQSSIVTIFAIWNTMMGTSLLSMPWGLSQSGFGFGIFLIILLGLITLYTAYIVIRSKDYLDIQVFEFTDVTQHYFGQVGKWLAFSFGIIAFIGGMLVYWVLMTNFLFMTGVFIHDEVTNTSPLNTSTNASDSDYPDTICHKPAEITNISNGFNFFANTSSDSTQFSKFWSIDKTVPLYLVALIFPLLNFKSPTFFTKFNCLGTLSVFYLWALVITKAAKWGFHLNFNSNSTIPVTPQFVSTFPALTGMLSLAFFLHNAVMTILSNNKHQQNNVRDLTIGYMLVMFTYLIVGILFFASFPLAKHCIAPILFDNLTTSDIQAVIGRAFLFFQMWTVFPLLAYMIRVQIMYFFFGRPYPSFWHVFSLNFAAVAICVIFAIFYPHIGDIIRYSGSLCGLVYIFVLPSIVQMKSVYKREGFKIPTMLIHSIIIAIGIANFVSQFVISPSK